MSEPLKNHLKTKVFLIGTSNHSNGLCVAAAANKVGKTHNSYNITLMEMKVTERVQCQRFVGGLFWFGFRSIGSFVSLQLCVHVIRKCDKKRFVAVIVILWLVMQLDSD